MKVSSVSGPAESAEWDRFVSSCTDSTPYHQFGWKRTITRSFGHECHYLVAMDDQNRWCGVLPIAHIRSRVFGNALVSLPFVNYGGILCKEQEAASLLIHTAEHLRKDLGAAHVELRNFKNRLDALPSRHHKVTMILDLEASQEGQWQAFNAKLRNQIRKAEKSKLRSAVGHMELLDGFYEVFARNMRDLGSPVHAKNFFRNVLQEFPESSRIIAVYLGKEVIAAGIILWFKDTMEVPWASSISDHNALCPNNLLYWDAIKFAISFGCKRFDFGRSTPNEGTYNFKKQWGAIPAQLNWQYLIPDGGHLPDLEPSSRKYRAAISIWRSLPVGVTKLLGPGIRKQISL
jgi:serine/alanine adding enzyme